MQVAAFPHDNEQPLPLRTIDVFTDGAMHATPELARVAAHGQHLYIALAFQCVPIWFGAPGVGVEKAMKSEGSFRSSPSRARPRE